MRRITFTKFAAIGITGWLSGILTERYRSKDTICSDTHRKYQDWRQGARIYCSSEPGEPIFNVGNIAKVYAAAKFPPKDPPANTKESGVVPFTADDTTDSSFLWGPEDPKQNRTSQIMRFGFPGLDNVRSFDDFVLSYDRRNRVPNWVFEHLNSYSVKHNSNVDRSKCDFYEDISMHPFFRGTNKDYKGSGYDRGHMAAAGNHRVAQQHCEQTFILSNIAPQVGKGFNRDAWNDLEKHVRGLTKVYRNVYVCTGPLYLPRREANGKNYIHYEVIGSNHVAVPTHFFKVVVGELNTGQLDLEAFIMPNQPIKDNTPVYNFMVPLEAIERAAGLIFFDKLQRNIFRQVNGNKPGY